MKNKSPCIDCKSRYPACQDVCEIRAKYIAIENIREQKIKTERRKEKIVNDFKVEVVTATKKAIGR